MKRVRWACPNGCAAVLGPRRPRRNDVVRYCLPCSAKTGKLVPRFAPVLVQRNEINARYREVKAQRTAAIRAARATAYYTIAGLNVRDEADKLRKLPVFGTKTDGMNLHRFDPTVRVRRWSSKPRSRLGTASRGLITIFAYPGIDVHDVRETLLHELSHVFVGPRIHHGPRFRTAFRIACEQAWGIRPRLEVRWHGEVSRMLRADALPAAAAESPEGSTSGPRDDDKGTE